MRIHQQPVMTMCINQFLFQPVKGNVFWSLNCVVAFPFFFFFHSRSLVSCLIKDSKKKSYKRKNVSKCVKKINPA